MTHPAAPVILIADDYALSDGVSRAIAELGALSRISGTSALVTLPRWREDAARLQPLRSMLALGLHLNLTLGAPLSDAPLLAPGGRFAGLKRLTGDALLGRVPLDDVESEFARQIEVFTDATGHLPDYLDGHQHTHALPGVRECLRNVVAAFWGAAPPFVRDPAETIARIRARGGARGRALAISTLARGFAAEARRGGIPVNNGFSGVTAFGASAAAVADDFKRAFSNLGPRPLVMCHPGFPDAELAALDPVTVRRRLEYEHLMNDGALIDRIWHPQRNAGGTLNWPAGESAHA